MSYVWRGAACHMRHLSLLALPGLLGDERALSCRSLGTTLTYRPAEIPPLDVERHVLTKSADEDVSEHRGHQQCRLTTCFSQPTGFLTNIGPCDLLYGSRCPRVCGLDLSFRTDPGFLNSYLVPGMSARDSCSPGSGNGWCAGLTDASPITPHIAQWNGILPW